MERSVLHVSLASTLFIGVSALGIFIACDNSDSDDSGNRASGGASAGQTGSGDAGSGGTSAKGGASATAGKSSTGGAAYPPSNPAGAPGNDENGGTNAEGGTGSEPVGGDAGAGGEAACVPAPPELPTDVPAAIVAPQGVTLLRSLHAVGTQNYRCRATAGAGGGDPTFAWTLVEPVADLFNSCGVKVGSHFRVPASDPPVPEWKYEIDGSSVSGARVDSAPVAGSIPELLLKENGHAGAGVFAAVTFVQRLHTVGGAAPGAASCDLAHIDETENVPYSAQYYFYSGGN